MSAILILFISCTDAAIMTYYKISVLNPIKSKAKTFLIMFSILCVTAITVTIFDYLIVFKPLITLSVTILLLVFLFSDKYWKRLVLMLSYFLISVAAELIVFAVSRALTGIDMASVSNDSNNENYLIVITTAVVLLCTNFAIVKFIAIPVWQRRLQAIRMMNLPSVASFIMLLTIGVMLLNMTSYQYRENETDVIENIFPWVYIAFITCCIVFLLVFVRNAQKQTKREIEATLIRDQLDLQLSYYEEIMRRYNKLRRLKHDFDNHMQVITAMNKSGKLEETQQYLNRLSKEFEDIDGVGFSGDPAVDSILFQKRERMIIHDIDVDYRIKLPENHTIEPVDICAVLFNLLDNAFNACLEVNPEDKRFIELETKIRAGFFVFVMKNSYNPRRNIADDSTVSETSVPVERGQTGLGTKIIAGIAERYDGDTLFEAQDSTFVSVVSFKLPC